ncbi:HAD family hydrolase [Ligilactobacillus salivarius]
MIKAAIFDLDGLLVDTEIVSLKIYQELLSEYGYSFTKEEYAKHYSGKTEKENIKRFIDTYNLSVSYQECLDEVLNIERKLISQGVELKVGVKSLLVYLKENNYKVALATSSTKDRAISILKGHDILSYFD